MKKQFMVLPLVFLLCFTFSCQQAEKVAEEPVVDVEADMKAIKALVDEFDVLLNAGDVEELVAQTYASDAVRMPPDEPMVKGKEAILEWFKQEAEQYTLQIDNVPEKVQVDGDLAFMYGTFSGTITPKAGGESFPAKGKWMGVYMRQADGTWKCMADIFNRDNPLPTEKE
jgi:uncharacterized protein (TIGR02246 family)